MNEIGVVLSEEFLRRMKSRAFIIATLIGAAGVVLMAILPRLLSGALGGDPNRIVLAGEPALTTAAQPLLKNDFDVAAVVAHAPAKPGAAYLTAHGKAASVVELMRSGDGLRVTVYAKDPSAYVHTFGRDLAPLQLALGIRAPLTVLQRNLSVPVDVRDVAGRFSDARAAATAKGIAFLLVFLLYLGILLNAQLIMSSVAEEKTSRIAELLVSTIDPAKLLVAKILASTAGGVIQVAVWVCAGLLAGKAAADMFSDTTITQSRGLDIIGPIAMPPGEIIAFLAFFIIGLAQYGVCYAAAASLINRTEDLGSVAGPLVIPVVIGFLLANIGTANPTAPSVVVTSQIPLLAPFVMFTRIAAGAVPVWQIVLSLAINIAAALLLAMFAGKVYRVGLLLYGRPPSLKQVWTTLRA